MGTTIFNVFQTLISLVNKIIYLLISLALVGFMWGVVKFLFSGTNENARSEGRKFMLYGILILFVMTSMWSIVYIMKDFLGVNVPVNQEYSIDGTTYTTDGETYKFDSEYNTDSEYKFDSEYNIEGGSYKFDSEYNIEGGNYGF
jgi:hypothetical protein